MVRLAVAVGFAAVLAIGAGRIDAACTDLLPGAAPAALAQRTMTAMDLARLRDIGLPEGALLGGASPLAVSPDGVRVAFVISRSDPDSNQNCVGVTVMGTAPGSVPRLIDQGGELILSTGNFRGMILTIGFPARVTPSWSPDGRWIAYLRRDHGSTQLWVAGADGAPARQLTQAAIDVEQFAWRPDSASIVFASRTGQTVERAANVVEARSGYHYDDRFMPMMANTPEPLAATPLSAYVADLASGGVRDAGEVDRMRLPVDPFADSSPSPSTVADDGRRVRAEHSGDNPLSALTLRVTTASGGPIPCSAPSCSGKYTGFWWIAGGRPLFFLRREGWDYGKLALYRWQPGVGAPKAVFRTSDVVDGCDLTSGKLLCVRESATQPRTIVRIDPQTGRSETVFDPNPEIRAIRFGRVERLFWRNDRGLEVRGDLVLPPGFSPGKRLPLIVTTYWSNGFLRGGTGNEYPIHVFAARGFAVLSLHRPLFVAEADPAATDWVKANAANNANWAERRSLQSAVAVGVQRVVDMGIADPKRVGITGLSDGASIVQFALINSRLFAAASISTCCLEPALVNATGGPAFTTLMRAQGFPAGTSDDRAFWAPGSLLRNAAAIETPLLMQLADREYLTALDDYAALRELGKPVDLYVFPDEYHEKWQPAHRLAIYQRNLDWFDFWLMGRSDPDPAKAEQYRRWRGLRDGGSAKTPG